MIDIYDSLWVPRLILGKAAEVIKNIGKAKSNIWQHLVMDEYEENQGYPRPQLKRDSFFSLDGEWDFSDGEERNYCQKIRVPFAPETKRSGIGRNIASRFWYRRSFSLSQDFIKDRVILHFGAVDQLARVYINDEYVGEHEGGYLPFSFDITKYVNSNTDNTIEVFVIDDIADQKYPYGKQVEKPGGMWYTQISGIWQSVWMESVANDYVERVVCRYEDGLVKINITGTASEYELMIFDPVDNNKLIMKKRLVAGDNSFSIDKPMLWSPESPYMYPAIIRTENDQVETYFTLRTISIEEINGSKRICLNHKPYFFHGLLDQGYFSDGIYTPVSYKWYETDILNMKELGFNTLRKHIKVEPARFYYDCDRLGMLVFQDMVNNGPYSYLPDTLMPTFLGQWKKDTANKRMTAEMREYFEKHSKELVEYLKGFSCIVYYTVFNEGWGQFDSVRIMNELRAIDPEKIYDGASGWFKQDETDVDSDHFYFHKIKPHKWKRPVIISECGGYVRAIREHSYFPDRIYGYGICETEDDLTDQIVHIYEKEIIPNMKKGICGAIYTQLSDVEEEVNGLYTYDRAVCKVNKAKMKALAEKIMETYKSI